MSVKRHAVLLPNVPGFPSESMKRYGDELFAALNRLNDPNWSFEALDSATVTFGRQLIPLRQGSKMASRLERFVWYPRLAKRATRDPDTGVFHVLDHSHANLTLSLPPEKAVITCHDVIPLLASKGLIPIPTGRMTRYTFPLRIRCMQHCRFVIADSLATKQNLIEHGSIPEAQIAVVYLGIDPVFTPDDSCDLTRPYSERSEILMRHEIPADAFVLMQLATGGRYKNTPTVLRVLKRLQEAPALRAGREVYLLRVGAPFFDDEQALIAELGIGEQIKFVGRVATDAGLAAYYRAADVFVFPSLWEGFGWPPLEAMACGTPVVTSNVASLPEVVGDAGITVAPNDLEGFVQAVHDLLTDDDQRAEFRRRALARAARFTWEQCARDTLAVYDQMVRT